MEANVTVFMQILPIVLFVALGYGFKVLKRDISKELVDFVMHFSLPAIAIVQIHKMEFNEAVMGVVWIAYAAMGMASVVSYVIGRFFGLNRKDLATLMVVVIFGNTSFVGLSYIEALYSKNEIVYGLVYDQVGTFIALLTFGVVIISWGGGHGDRPKALAKKIFFSPPLVAIIAAFFLRDVTFPVAIMQVLEKLEVTLIPLVTMIVGMKLEFKAMAKELKLTTVAISLKLMAIPALMLLCVYPFVDMGQTWAQVTILEVAMPTMTMATVFAIEGGLNRHLAINTLGLGIVMSFLSVPFWNFVLS